jgi:rubredoxin
MYHRGGSVPPNDENEVTEEKVEKKYRCPACGYTCGKESGLVVEVTPPRKGMTDPSGVYCPYCTALERFRNVPQMNEVK